MVKSDAHPVDGDERAGGRRVSPRLQAGHEVIAPQRAQFDLARPETLPGLLDDVKPDLILNPAAYTAVDRAEDESEIAFRINAEAPAAIARWAASRHVPLLHFSTDYVFDGAGDTPWREDSPTAPLSVYGASKLAGEQAVRDAGGAHLVVRTSWVYAATGANFLRTIVRLARERKELRIVADQIGAPTSGAAIAEGVVRIVQSTPPELASRSVRSGGVVHLACAGETSWHGFASAIAAGLKSRGVSCRSKPSRRSPPPIIRPKPCARATPASICPGSGTCSASSPRIGPPHWMPN